jgi:uncharacterized protein
VGKVIFWIVVFFGVLLALRMLSVYKARKDARENDDKPRREANRDTTPAGDTMVRCANCGVYIPKAQSVMSKNGAVCGDSKCERLTKK